jgi:zinc transport system permease protein
MGGGISHAAFGGVGLGILLGINPMLAAIPFAVGGALLMGYVQKRAKIHEDVGIGMLWVISMALGVIFIQFHPGYTADLFSYLFGNILTVTGFDLGLMLVLDAVIIIAAVMLFHEFRAITFDEEFSMTVGIPARMLYYVLLALIALSVVLLMRVVGVVLVIAYLAIPATVARMFTHDMRSMMLAAIGVGIGASFVGFMLSYYFDLPSGALIVLTLGAFFGIALLWQRFYGRE